MGHTHAYAERRLPVALKLVTSEGEIPAGYAVKLAEHTLSAVLVNGRLALLCRCKFTAVAKHINTGQAEAPVRAHTVADCRILAFERGLLHHMTREHYSVFLTPAADIVCKGNSKTLGNVVVIAVACHGNLTVGKLPEKLGQFFKKLLAVHLFVCIRKIRRVGQEGISVAYRLAEHLFACNLRLIGENCRNGFAEILTYALFIALVCYVDKLVHSLGRKSINVGLQIEPVAFTLRFAVGIPAIRTLLVIRKAAVAFKAAVLVKRYGVSCKQAAVFLSYCGGRAVVRAARA